MAYTLNYNKPPLHAGDEIELDDATAKRLIEFGYVSGDAPENVTPEVDEVSDAQVDSPEDESEDESGDKEVSDEGSDEN